MWSWYLCWFLPNWSGNSQKKKNPQLLLAQKWIFWIFLKEKHFTIGFTCQTLHSASAMHLAAVIKERWVWKQLLPNKRCVFTICKYLLGSAAVFKSKIATLQVHWKNLVNTGGIPRCCCRPVFVFLAPSSWAQHNTSASASWLSWNASLYETPGAKKTALLVNWQKNTHELFPVFLQSFNNQTSNIRKVG